LVLIFIATLHKTYAPSIPVIIGKFQTTSLKHSFEVSMSRKRTHLKKGSLAFSTRQQRKLHKRNMIWLWIGLGALAIIIAGILAFSPKGTPSVQITPAEAYAKLQQGAFILDVRTQDEFNESHIKGSTLIPLDELQDRLDEVPIDKEIVVVCRSGRRSQTGASILQKAGVKQVSSMKGGLQAWMDANYPVEKGTP
jgi:phage shock protein E